MGTLGSFGKIAEIVETEKSQEERQVEIDKLESFEFYGSLIHVRDWISPYPMMIFSSVIDLNSPIVSIKSLAALYSVLKASIVEEDWPLFNALSMQQNPDSEILLGLVSAIYASWTARPLNQSSVSSQPQEPGPDLESPEGSLPPSMVSSQQDLPEVHTLEPEAVLSS